MVVTLGFSLMCPFSFGRPRARWGFTSAPPQLSKLQEGGGVENSDSPANTDDNFGLFSFSISQPTRRCRVWFGSLWRWDNNQRPSPLRVWQGPSPPAPLCRLAHPSPLTCGDGKGAVFKQGCFLFLVFGDVGVAHTEPVRMRRRHFQGHFHQPKGYRQSIDHDSF